MLPAELTVPVQVLFASSTDEGVVLDCTVAGDVVAGEVVEGTSVRIPSGSLFSLLIDRAESGAGESAATVGPDAALVLLERWCSAGVIVEATTSASSKCLVLRHEHEEVVLEIL